jgi:hypothetical protein
MALFFVEAFCVHYFNWSLEVDMYIFLVPTVFFLFYITTHIELNHNPIYKHFRELGILIFYCHMFIYPFIEKGLLLLGIKNSLLRDCGTVVVTIIVSEIIMKLSSNPKYIWIKTIYN